MANYDALKQAVIDGNAARVKELTQQALDAGDGPQSLLDEALIPAMDVVGEKFSNREFFIPEMLIAARAMQAGLGLIKPLLTAGESRSKGKVVIGTVKGDLHDIGKNLVGMMLQGAGFEVVDLGADVKTAKFVEAVQAQKPDFIMMSALLTTKSGFWACTASTNLAGFTSAPRSTTSKPAPCSIIPTRFLPMSCRSPLTVPITTLPLDRLSPAVSSGLISPRPACIALAAISISGMKNSRLENFSPTTSIAGISASSSRDCGPSPASSACWVNSFTLAALPSITACFNAS